MVKKRGSRSSHDGKPWKCRCGTVNRPTKHRFFKLPAFQCRNCQRKLALDFKFCLGKIEVEGKSLIGKVLDQKKKPYCVAFAYAKAAEITERVFCVKHGIDPDLVKPISPYILEETFAQKFPSPPSADGLTLAAGIHKVLHMGLILRSEGIQRTNLNERYIAADVSTIPCDAFDQICQSLAEGIPLVATYWVGKRRGLLPYCRIYKSPRLSRFKDKKTRRRGHAVVLIGAGMKKGTIKGGIGKLRETDLTKNVVRLSHSNETGGDRRLQDQSEQGISKFNYVLMMGRENQGCAQRLQKLREDPNSGYIRADVLDDEILSDDEGIYP